MGVSALLLDASGQETLVAKNLLATPSRYLLTLDVSPSGIQFKPTSKKLLLKVNGEQIASLSVVQPTNNCVSFDDQAHCTACRIYAGDLPLPKRSGISDGQRALSSTCNNMAAGKYLLKTTASGGSDKGAANENWYILQTVTWPVTCTGGVCDTRSWRPVFGVKMIYGGQEESALGHLELKAPGDIDVGILVHKCQTGPHEEHCDFEETSTIELFPDR